MLHSDRPKSSMSRSENGNKSYWGIHQRNIWREHWKRNSQHSHQSDRNKKKDDRKSKMSRKQKTQNNEQFLLRPTCHTVVRFPGHWLLLRAQRLMLASLRHQNNIFFKLYIIVYLYSSSIYFSYKAKLTNGIFVNNMLTLLR